MVQRECGLADTLGSSRAEEQEGLVVLGGWWGLSGERDHLSLLMRTI